MEIQEFIEKLESLVLNLDAIKQNQKDVKIVYTPLHGTGGMPVKRILNDLGFENVAFFNRFFKSHVGVTPKVYRNG
mgnify:CR=1 FL=1